MTLLPKIILSVLGIIFLYIVIDSIRFTPSKNNEKIDDKDIKELLYIVKNKITPYEFEKFCTQLFREIGYKAITTKGSNDKGKDIVVTDNQNVCTYVECKQYSNTPIGRPLLQKLIAATLIDNANKCIFITTSTFSKPAVDYIKECKGKIDVELWDLDSLYFILVNLTKDSVNRLYLSLR